MRRDPRQRPARSRSGTINISRFSHTLLRLSLALVFWLLTFLALVPGAVIVTFFLQLWLDQPQENYLLVIGATASALVGGGAWVSLFLFQRRGWWIPAGAGALIWVSTVAFSVFHQAETPPGFIGSTLDEVEKIFRSTPNPPSFLFSIGPETRLVHVVTPDRPKTFYPDRQKGGPITFGLAVPEPPAVAGTIEVIGVISDRLKEPILRLPWPREGSWNDVVIPEDKLPPLLKGIEVQVQTPDPSDRAQVLVSEPLCPAKGLGPNVVLVVVDTLRADQVNAANSPFLDRLSRRSVVFRQAMATSSWTVPATTSILTGLYPHQHGHISNAHLELNPGTEFLARQFQRSGYRTAGFSANVLISPKFKLASGFDQFTTLGIQRRFYWNSGRILNLAARDWLSRHGDSTFFVYLHYMDPHYPYLAPWPHTFHRLEGLGAKLESLLSFFLFDFQDYTNRWPIEHPEKIPGVMARYQGEIRYWDAQFEDLLGFLESRGLLQNTIVAVVGDHGESFGEQDHFRHGSSLLQSEVHVPLIIFDGRSQQSRVIDHLVSPAEVPTILAGMAGIPPADSWTGRTLDQFVGPSWQPDDRACFSLLSVKLFHYLRGERETLRVAISARRRAEKIIVQYEDADDRTEYSLYRLDLDPGETRNLWDRPAFQLPLYQEMKAFLPDPKSMIYAPPEQGLREKGRELRALGYLE